MRVPMKVLKFENASSLSSIVTDSYEGSSMFLLISHDYQEFLLIPEGSSWLLMVPRGSSWFLVVSQGFS